MKRTFIMVLDSFGIGAAHDAHKFGDEGSIHWVTSQMLAPVAKRILVVKASAFT